MNCAAMRCAGLHYYTGTPPLYVVPSDGTQVPPLNGYVSWTTVGARLPCLSNVGAAGCGITIQDSHGGLSSEYTVYTTISNLVHHSWMVQPPWLPSKVE